jgi:early secretory antigenic target protein ESAT-6
MDHVKVDFGALGQLGGDIDMRVKAIETQLNDLAGQIRQLEGIWEGSANEGFQAEKNKWFTSADSLRGTLARIATAVHTANDNYQSTEKANASRWNA